MIFEDKDLTTNCSSIRVTDDCRKLTKLMCSHVQTKFDLRAKPTYSYLIEKLVSDYLLKEGVEYKLNEIE